MLSQTATRYPRLIVVAAVLCAMPNSRATEATDPHPPPFVARVSCGTLQGSGVVAFTVGGWVFSVPIVCQSSST